jgi:hypothetical protein
MPKRRMGYVIAGLIVFIGGLLWFGSRVPWPERLSAMTKIPLLHVELSLKDLYKLEARADPSPGSPAFLRRNSYVVARMRMADRDVKVEMRARGSFAFHRQFIRKSWRVKTAFTEPLLPGAMRFNLARSRLPLFEDHLAYQLAHTLGVPAPQSQPMLLVANGEWHGLYHVSEQMDEAFLASHGLPYGPLYGERKARENVPVSEVAWVTVPGQPGRIGSPWTNGFTDYTATLWQSLTLRDDGRAGKAEALDDLLRMIHADSVVFEEGIAQILDIPAFLDWLTLQSLGGSSHTDVHNIRLYFNPATEKFQFFSWDLLPFNDKMSHHLTPVSWVPLGQILFLKLFTIPEFAELRNRHLWSVMTSTLPQASLIARIDKLYHALRPVYARDAEKAMLGRFDVNNLQMQNRLFTIEEFDVAYAQLKAWVNNRYSYMHHALSTSQLVGQVHRRSSRLRQLQIRTASEAGVLLSSVVLDTSAGKQPHYPVNELKLYRDTNHNGMLDATDQPVPTVLETTSAGLTHLTLREPMLLLAERTTAATGLVVADPISSVGARPLMGHMEQVSVLPTDFSLLLRGTHSQMPAINLAIKNSITQRPIPVVWGTLPQSPEPITWGRHNAERLASLFPPSLFASPTVRTLHWQGAQQIDETIMIGPQETLVIAPGTTIQLAPGSSLLVFGQVSAVGTAQQPIRFTALHHDEPWGVIAINGAKSVSQFQHVIIEHGSEARLRSVSYSGALSVYNSDVHVQHSHFLLSHGEDAINVKYGAVELASNVFTQSASDAIDCDFSTGHIVDNQISGSGNDAIDLGSSVMTVAGNNITTSGDKGISIGGSSRVTLVDNTLAAGTFGLAVKDSSSARWESGEISGHRIGIGLYVKNRNYKLSPPTLELLGGRIDNNDVNLWKDTRAHVVQQGGHVGSDLQRAQDLDFDWSSLMH